MQNIFKILKAFYSFNLLICDENITTLLNIASGVFGESQIFIDSYERENPRIR